MKKFISFIISMAIVLGTFPALSVSVTATGFDGTAAVDYAGGTGTADDPYQISTAGELKYAQEKIASGGHQDKAFILMSDIDFNDQEWTPLGRKNCPFNGSFNGNGHKVSNLKITETTATLEVYLGFFGWTGKAVSVTDLGIETITIAPASWSDDAHSIGGMVGSAAGTFERCYVKGATLTPALLKGGRNGAGGFAGYVHDKATFKDCYVYRSLLRNDHDMHVGGFFGRTTGDAGLAIKFENCYVAEVSMPADASYSKSDRDPLVYAFGYSGLSSDDLTVTNCYSTWQDKYTAYAWGDRKCKYTNEVIASVSDMAKFSKATPSATKDTIVSAMSTDVWATSDAINGGYPYLLFVAPTPIPTATPDPTVAPTATPDPTVAPTATPDPTAKPVIEAATAYAGGNGTKANPYQISTAGELKYAQQKINAGTDNTKYFILTADIDYCDNEWTPMGTSSKPFKGDFDGDGHKVSNLLVTTFIKDIGFFGYTDKSANIHDLGIENINITVPVATDNRPDTLGGMVGNAAGTFERCYVKGTGGAMTLKTSSPAFSVKNGIGGFASYIRDEATFKNCYVYNIAMRDAQDKLEGGFFAQTNTSTTANMVFENCYAANVSMAPFGTYAAGYREPLVYAFGCSALTSNLSVTNSFSTWADQFTVYEYAAAGTSGRSYNGTVLNSVIDMAQFSKGTKSATKEQVTSALVKPENIEWATDSAKNGGYPYLTFATPAPTPTPTPTPPPVVPGAKMDTPATTVLPDGKMSVTVNVTYTLPDNDTIKFMVVKETAEGDVSEVKEQEKTVQDGRDIAETFTVTLDSAPATGETLKYYLWGDDGIPLIDNAPTKVRNFVASSKVKGLTLTWDASEDDSGMAVVYNVYKDGRLVTQTDATSYSTQEKLTGQHVFSVEAVDLKSNAGAAVASEKLSALKMYYANADGPTYGLTYKVGGTTEDAYSVVSKVDGKNVYTSETYYDDKHRYVYFALTADCNITEDDNDLIFEIDYYDKGTLNLVMVYNRIIKSGEKDDYVPARQQVLVAEQENSLTWKTAVVEVSNAALRNSGNSSGSSFGILLPYKNDPGLINVREIRVIKKSEYGEIE